MSGEPKMFRINPENRQSQAITEVEFSNLGIQERRDLQEWIAANPDILGEDLLIIGKEFSGFDRTSERLDLLAVDWDGKLVIIELKRDDTGADAHWQAIKYASYLRHATADDLIRMLTDYRQVTQAEAVDLLLHHLQADDFSALNHDQRIIIASHRFAPEVTSAVLWLNEKAPAENLITCVQLIPYHDPQQDALYVQASTIIPLPGIENYVVKVGENYPVASALGSGSLGEKLSRTFEQSRNHETTPFFARVGDLVIDGLSGDIKPNRKSKWSGRGHEGSRYYHFWYSSPPWSNWGTSYRVNLHEQGESGEWRAVMEFQCDQDGLYQWLDDNAVYGRLADGSEQLACQNGWEVLVRSDTLNDEYGEKIAATVRRFIEEVTPVVNAFEDAGNEEAV